MCFTAGGQEGARYNRGFSANRAHFAQDPAVSERLAVALQYALPKRLLTQLAGKLAGLEGGKATTAVIRWFIKRYGGAAFLLWYGWRNAVSAWRGTAALEAGNGAAQQTLGQTLLACLMLSLLNPHVYLDTVVLLGSIGSQQADDLRPLFAAGAITASIVWFVLLGYGARLLVPLFSRPMAWRVLDALVALMLWGIAASLLLA